MLGDVPYKFYTSKAFDFCSLGQKFNKQGFLDHLNSSDIDKIYNDSFLEPDDTFAYNLKLHVSKLKFPLDFKSALNSIFNFLYKLTALNPFDKKFKFKILNNLFTDSIQYSTKADKTYKKFCSESFKMKFFHLDKSPLSANSPDLNKKIVVSEFLDDMLLNPYQPHEYQFATRILDCYQDRSIALDHLYEFFKLIRPQEFEETLERSKQTTKIFNKDYYLPKNNFYNWMKKHHIYPEKKLSDDFVPFTLPTSESNDYIYYNIHLKLEKFPPALCTLDNLYEFFDLDNDESTCMTKLFPTYYVMKRPVMFPRGYEKLSQKDQMTFFYTFCEGILYQGNFYINPKAIELQS